MPSRGARSSLFFPPIKELNLEGSGQSHHMTKGKMGSSLRGFRLINLKRKKEKKKNIDRIQKPENSL